MVVGKAVSRRLCLGVAVALLVAATTCGPAAARGWTIQPTPALPGAAQPPEGPGGTAEGTFAGVSCASADACTAVGQESPGNVPAGELAEVWDGTAWSVIETDTLDFDFGSKLVSVSCGAPGACIAVGSGQSPDTTAVAQSLSTTGAQAASPGAVFSIEELLSVSCASTSECMAVGNTGDGQAPLLIDHLAAGAWTSLNPALPADSEPSMLSGVSCVASTFCMALGADADSNTVAETWDGTSWSLTPAAPNPPGAAAGSLGAVSCPEVGDCVATGSWSDQSGSHPLVERFRHGAWSLIAAPPDVGGVEPSAAGIACPGRQTCTVVGDIADASGNVQTYAARLHRGLWQIQATPTVPGTAGNSFASVSCPTRRECTAAGQSVGNGTSDVGPLEPLVEHWVRRGHHHDHRHRERGRTVHRGR